MSRGIHVLALHPPDLEVLTRILRAPKSCGLVAEHYKEIGWKPKYTAHHIIESADDEISFILENIPDEGPAKQAIAI